MINFPTLYNYNFDSSHLLFQILIATYVGLNNYGIF